jgi:hypothetical protein
MTNDERELRLKIAEMEGDIITTVSVLIKFSKVLGLDYEEMQEPNFDIMSKLPRLVTSIMPKLMGGGLAEELEDFKHLAPILGKYKYLITNIIDLDGK